MSTGKANGVKHDAALFGRCMECADDRLAVTGAEAQPTVTVTMRLAEAEWHVVRQEVLPRFEAVCNCRVQAIDVPPEFLVQRLRTMQQVGRMGIDLFAQDNVFRNWSIQPWLPLALPGLAVCGLLVWLLSWEEFALATYLTLGAKSMPPQVYYYLYTGELV